MSGFAQGTGLNSSVPAFRAIWRAWMGTMWAAESAVVRAGGFTWSNLDCELDDGDGGPSGGVSHRELPYAANGTAPLLSACGLSKANANPRADDKAAAPVLYRGINRSLAQQHCAQVVRSCFPFTSAIRQRRSRSAIDVQRRRLKLCNQCFHGAAERAGKALSFDHCGLDAGVFRSRAGCD